MSRRILIGIALSALALLATTGNGDPTDNARVPSTPTTEASCR